MGWLQCYFHIVIHRNVLVYWKIGILVYWYIGILVNWYIDILVYCNALGYRSGTDMIKCNAQTMHSSVINNTAVIHNRTALVKVAGSSSDQKYNI